jgi:hypothetical protein
VQNINNKLVPKLTVYVIVPARLSLGREADVTSVNVSLHRGNLHGFLFLFLNKHIEVKKCDSGTCLFIGLHDFIAARIMIYTLLITAHYRTSVQTQYSDKIRSTN